MASQSIATTTASKVGLPAPILPVDTFTEQLTHEPQRKAKLYSLPLIRTAIALITVFWVVGVYAGNPDGFWQAQINTFMVPICDDAEVLGYVTASAMMKPAKLIGVTVSDKRGEDGRVVGFKVSRRHGFILAIEKN